MNPFRKRRMEAREHQRISHETRFGGQVSKIDEQKVDSNTQYSATTKSEKEKVVAVNTNKNRKSGRPSKTKKH